MKRTDKEVCRQVVERSQGRCEAVINGRRCSSRYVFGIHHIFRRGSAETPETLIGLCWYHHEGTNGVHGKSGHTLDIYLKQQAQHRLRNKGFSDSEIRSMCKGKLYI